MSAHQAIRYLGCVDADLSIEGRSHSFTLNCYGRVVDAGQGPALVIDSVKVAAVEITAALPPEAIEQLHARISAMPRHRERLDGEG